MRQLMGRYLWIPHSKDEIKDIVEAYRLIGDRLIREYKISKVGGDTFKSKIE